MASNSDKDGRRSVLSSFNDFIHRSRRSENSNVVVNIPAAGFASTLTPSPTVASPQHDAAPRSELANPSHPTRRPIIEAPPPYSPGTRNGSVDGPPMEDDYALLKNFDTIFLIDDSGSMSQHWDEVKAILSNIAPICTSYDEDGIDIYFLNHENSETDQAGQLARGTLDKGKACCGYNNVRDANQVTEIFDTVRPSGSTWTGARLRSILQPYMKKYEEKLAEFRKVDQYNELSQKDLKPINVIVFTDGAPQDDLPEEIIDIAKRLDQVRAPLNQVGIQFFLVGGDERALAYFQYLDDDLYKRAKDIIKDGVLRDIVDTTTWDRFYTVVSGSNRMTKLGLTADGVLKVVLGAVVRRLDRQKTSIGLRRIGSHATPGGGL